MIEELNLFQIYHLKDVSLSAELFISCSILQLTFYVTSVSFIRRSGFVILNQQVYHIGFLVLLFSALLIFNEDSSLVQSFLSSNDYLSFVSKLVVCISSLFFIFVVKNSSKDDLRKHNFEYVILVLAGVLGSLLLCSANDLLTAYLAMELQSVAFYLMAAFKKDSNYSIESGLKYFIVGSFASALFLFGSSFIYGCVGSFNFNDFKLFIPLLSIVDFNGASDALIYPYEHYFFQLFPLFDQIFPVLSFKLGYPLIDRLWYDFYINFFHFDGIFSFHEFMSENAVELPIWFLMDNNVIVNPVNFTDLSTNVAHSISWYGNDLVYILYCLFADMAFYGKEPFYSAFYEASHIYTPVFFSDIWFYADDFKGLYTSNHDHLLISQIIEDFNFAISDGLIPIESSSLNLDLIYMGFMLVCLSLFIKLAVAPFHYWSLDVYEGSPNQSTFFFAVIPKIGFFVLLIRICYLGFYDLLNNWQVYFLLLSTVSIFVGSLGGLEQRKLKSLLAYSSVSHTGYLLLSFSTNGVEGVQMMLYYIVIFMLSGLCFWSVYLFLRQKTRHSYYNKQNRELGDLVLLQDSNPALALTLMVTLFSIAGIPPLVGFLAKLGIFLVAITSSTYIVALFSILLSVLSTFYYIRIIKILYFENVIVGKLYHPISTTKAILISALLLAIILLCIYPMVLYFSFHKAMLLI